MIRVKSALWVAAYVRRVNGIGDGFAVVVRKGAEDAGAILIRVDRPDGTGQLYVPAPQSAYEGRPDDRMFVARFPAETSKDALDAAIHSEIRMDPDVWVVAVDDRAGRHYLDAALTV